MDDTYFDARVGGEMLISKEFEFEAGHRLDDYCEGKKNTCGNPAGHGHSYKLIVDVAGLVDHKSHMIIDFKTLKEIVKGKIVDVLDHSFINVDVPEIGYPTAENIVIWIWNQLSEDLNASGIYKEGKTYRLFEVKLYETRTSYVAYRGLKKVVK